MCQTVNCTNVSAHRCFTDNSTAMCSDVSLYKQRFTKGTEHHATNRRLLSVKSTDGEEKMEEPSEHRGQWSLGMTHILAHTKCKVDDCGDKPCTRIIWGTGLPDVIEAGVLVPMSDTLTCECGPDVKHALYVSESGITSSCANDVSIRHRTSRTADIVSRVTQRRTYDEICLPSSLNDGKCICPIGHYMVGDFFCAEQFDLFVHDRIVSIK